MKGLKIKMKEFKIPVTITEADINADIITALEGGVNYWMGIKDKENPWLVESQGRSFSEKFGFGLLSGNTAKVFDIEDDSQKYELTLEKLLKGYELYLNKKHHGLDPTFEIRDVEHTDVIFQLAIFGDIVYG
jgi:hypothetical protein